ncbi:MAG: RpiB/LacA/LacB family sugar-phosphate isomerase [Patescibacteria group bacterium]|nr:RpiB/LacA/LacB family sugar-phosphate isomerase [Patescibacteria group bacterium]
MLYLGADHNGYFLKEKLKKELDRLDMPWRDSGAKSFNKADDYVDFAVAVGAAVGERDFGILICGSGHGMVIAANKLPGIRAFMPPDVRSARDGRRDDHANVLVLPAWRMSYPKVTAVLRAFLKQPPGRASRYLRRLQKVKRLEK